MSTTNEKLKETIEHHRESIEEADPIHEGQIGPLQLSIINKSADSFLELVKNTEQFVELRSHPDEFLKRIFNEMICQQDVLDMMKELKSKVSSSLSKVITTQMFSSEVFNGEENHIYHLRMILKHIKGLQRDGNTSDDEKYLRFLYGCFALLQNIVYCYCECGEERGGFMFGRYDSCVCNHGDVNMNLWDMMAKDFGTRSIQSFSDLLLRLNSSVNTPKEFA